MILDNTWTLEDLDVDKKGQTGVSLYFTTFHTNKSYRRELLNAKPMSNDIDTMRGAFGMRIGHSQAHALAAAYVGWPPLTHLNVPSHPTRPSDMSRHASHHAHQA